MGKRDKKGEKKQYADPENIYKLDDERSVDTVHAKPGNNKPKAKGYGGSPGAPAFQVGGKKRQEEDANVETVEINSDVDEEKGAAATAPDNFEYLSREELIEKLKKASLSSKPTGSAPKSGNGWDHSESSDEGESMSDDGSSSESSSGSSGESTDEGSDGTPSG